MNIRAYLQAASQLAIWIVMFFAGLVLLGFCLDILVLKRMPPVEVVVQAKTAAMFLLSALATICVRQSTRSSGRSSRLWYLGQVSALLVVLFALASLFGHYFGVNIGLDQLLFSEGARIGSSFHNQAPIIAMTFLFVAASILSIDVKWGADTYPHQYLVLAAAVMSQLTLVGYAFGMPVLYSSDRFTYLASPDALVFLLLSLGIFLYRYDIGLAKVLASESLGGAMARRVMSMCIVLPLLLGSLRQAGPDIGWPDTNVVLIFLLVLTIWSFPAVLFWNCVKLDEIDSARAMYQRQLEQTVDKLARINVELEQFASIASHDLKEPLRSISNSLQLLSRRYESSLDQDARRLMNYACDGAHKMHSLVNDLLVYARAGSEDGNLTLCECKQAVDESLENLQVAIDDAGATISCDPLPEVVANHAKLVGLFQNLIGNAIKFRGEEKPVVHISAHKRRNEWLFSVSDNGIGIDMEFAERAFVIFKRLHGNKYPGTGIGLAVCRKIVENLGGKMWLQSEIGKGTTVYFTLPAPKAVSGE